MQNMKIQHFNSVTLRGNREDVSIHPAQAYGLVELIIPTVLEWRAEVPHLVFVKQMIATSQSVKWRSGVLSGECMSRRLKAVVCEL